MRHAKSASGGCGGGGDSPGGDSSPATSSSFAVSKPSVSSPPDPPSSRAPSSSAMVVRCPLSLATPPSGASPTSRSANLAAGRYGHGGKSSPAPTHSFATNDLPLSSSASTIISSNLASLTASAFEPMSTPAPVSAQTSTHMASSWPVWRSASKAQSLFRENLGGGSTTTRSYRTSLRAVIAKKRTTSLR